MVFSYPRQYTAFFRASLLWGVSLIALMPQALALPQGQAVQSGDIDIANSEAEMNITQTSDKGLIHWQSFNIDAGEKVHFSQPSANSLTINKVVGDNQPSHIFGSLSANGQIMLINKNGILFGENSQIDVGGLVATTMDAADADLLASDQITLTDTSSGTAAIVNAGKINVAEGGLLALVAPGVAHLGVIKAKMGQVQLASGKSTILDLAGDGLINLEMQSDVGSVKIPGTDLTMAAGVQTTEHSKIEAEGGEVILTAAFAKQVLNEAINTSVLTEQAPVMSVDGQITAQNGGRIVIHAGSTKNGFNQSAAPNLNGIEYGDEKVANEVKIAGHLSVQGAAAGQKGGEITISGQHIHLQNGSELRANGAAGSGNIAVGSNKNFEPGPSGSSQTIDLDHKSNGQLTRSPVATSLVVGVEAKQIVNSGDETSHIANAAYVEVQEGTAPLVLLAGHDGAYAPGHSGTDEKTLLAADEKIGPKVVGGKNRDTYTYEIAQEMAKSFEAETGAKPYILRFNLQRAYVDVNRSYVRADQKDEAMALENWNQYESGTYNLGADAYKSWHILADRVTEKVTDTHGSGFLIDLHGFGSHNDPDVHKDGGFSKPKDIANFDVPVEVMLGYGALDPDDLAQINGDVAAVKSQDQFASESSLYGLYQSLKDKDPGNPDIMYDIVLGEKSFAHALKESTNGLNPVDFDGKDDGQDIWYTPISDHMPENQANVHHFYQGGFNSDAHGSGGTALSPEPYAYGKVDSVQLEIPSHIRWVKESHATFGKVLAEAGKTYLAQAYQKDMSSESQHIAHQDNVEVAMTADNHHNMLLSQMPKMPDPIDPDPIDTDPIDPDPIDPDPIDPDPIDPDPIDPDPIDVIPGDPKIMAPTESGKNKSEARQETTQTDYIQDADTTEDTNIVSVTSPRSLSRAGACLAQQRIYNGLNKAARFENNCQTDISILGGKR